MEDNELSELKPISTQKIEANRRNALKSTGPRTPRGKANVRYNAVKHGFFAKQIAISSRLIGEDPKEFQDLLRGLMESLQPVGTAEELLVQQIALGFWRERRALRAEMAEIGKARADHDPSLGRLVDAELELDMLTTAQQEIAEKGDLPLETKLSLSRRFNWDLLYGVDDESRHAKRQLALQEKIQEEIANLEHKRQANEETEKFKTAERYSIPEKEDLLRILRYQAQNNRGLSRAFTQLEQLQRRRQGKDVPSSVKPAPEGVQPAGELVNGAQGADELKMKELKVAKQSQEVLSCHHRPSQGGDERKTPPTGPEQGSDSPNLAEAA